MQYKVELIHSDEGYAIGCPELPGCWSQGATEEEAIKNQVCNFGLSLVLTQETLPEGAEKRVIVVDVDQPQRRKKNLSNKPFKIVPLAIKLPEFTKVEDLFHFLESADRL